jgi:hypothetical protein
MPERIGLRRPIQMTGAISEAVEVVLGRLVIRDHRLECFIHHCDFSSMNVQCIEKLPDLIVSVVFHFA